MVALAAYSTAVGLLARNPFPNLVPVYAAIARELPDGEIQFRSSRPDREGLYSHTALLLGAAPRPIQMVYELPTAEWVVTDRVQDVRGYQRVREWKYGIALHRRAR
jgi:hypothetical protein